MIDVVRKIIQLKNAPYKGLQYDIVEYPGYFTIRLYRDNFDSFPDTKRLAFSEWISEIIKNVRASGVDIYLEVYNDRQSSVHSQRAGGG